MASKIKVTTLRSVADGLMVAKQLLFTLVSSVKSDFTYQLDSPCCLIHHQKCQVQMRYNPETKEWRYYCGDQYLIVKNDRPIRQQLRPVSETINQIDLPPVDFHGHKCLMIEAGMGIGKTKLLTQYVKTIPAETSVLILSGRRSLTGDYLQRFNSPVNLGFESYLDMKGQINRPRLIMQVDSLPRIDTSVRKYDLVIIDEIDSILEQFTSNLTRKPVRCHLTFEYLIQQAKNVILLDAQCNTPRVTSFVKSFFDQSCWYLKNTAQRQTNKSLLMYPNEETLTDHLLTEIQNGQKIAIVSTSKTYLDSLKVSINRLPNQIKTRIYSVDTPFVEASKELRNVNLEWCKYQVVGYTPTIGMGVSFETEHFDQMFAIGDLGSVNTMGFTQMLGRVRKLKTGQIHLYLTNKTNNLPETFEEVEQYLINQNNLVHEQSVDVDRFLKLNEVGKLFCPDPDDWSYQNIIHSVALNHQSANHFKASVTDRMIELGYPMADVESGSDDLIMIMRNEKKQNKQVILIETKERLDTVAAAESEEDLQVLKAIQDKTQTQADEQLKSTAIMTYHTDQIKAKDYDYQRMRSFKLREQLGTVSNPDTIINQAVIEQETKYRSKARSNIEALNRPLNTMQHIAYTLLRALGFDDWKQISEVKLTGQQLATNLPVLKQVLADQIETISVMRANQKRKITRQQWLQLDLHRVSQFVNSITGEELGLKLCLLDKDTNNSAKSIWGLEDTFAEYKFVKQGLISGQCDC